MTAAMWNPFTIQYVEHCHSDRVSWYVKSCRCNLTVGNYHYFVGDPFDDPWLGHNPDFLETIPLNNSTEFRAPLPQCQMLIFKLCSVKRCLLTLASVTLNSLRIYWGMLYSAMGSTTKYWYLADLSAGQYWWHFSCREWKIEYHNEPQHSPHTLASLCSFPELHSFNSYYIYCLKAYILMAESRVRYLI